MTTNNFTLEYNVTGSERKRLVNAIAAHTQADAKYLGAPSFAYEVDYFSIDRNGCVSFDDRADSEEIEGLIEALAEKGFVAAKTAPAEPEGNNTAPTEEAGSNEAMGLTVEVPLESVQVGNLTKLLDAKGSLIKKALGIANLPIEIKDTSVSFPWFEKVEQEDATAYTHFISALCEMSRNQKRITATEKDVDNEKYAFRCFLLRLGFIGSEFKQERKILLRNLTGSSAFKSGAKKEVVA